MATFVTQPQSVACHSDLSGASIPRADPKVLAGIDQPDLARSAWMKMTGRSKPEYVTFTVPIVPPGLPGASGLATTTKRSDCRNRNVD